ncbi:MAG: antitoxin family protein [Chloroflexota bacterium]
MNTRIATIYENGVLRPLTPLSLPERARVRIYVEKVEERPATSIDEHRVQVQETLAAAGLLLIQEESHIAASPLLAERREELARLFAAEKPLSEVIIEEREGR